MGSPDQRFETEGYPQGQIIDFQPDGSMIVHVSKMIPRRRYPFQYPGGESAIAVRQARGSVRILRDLGHTQNPVMLLVNKLREPILTTPHIEGFQD